MTPDEGHKEFIAKLNKFAQFCWSIDPKMSKASIMLAFFISNAWGYIEASKHLINEPIKPEDDKFNGLLRTVNVKGDNP